MSEFTRRMQLAIYNEVEFEKALAWVKENCKEGHSKYAQNVK